MGTRQLYFDVRDIFRSPRLALGGKKLWTFLLYNLIGYFVYFVCTILAFQIDGVTFSEVWGKYGLYPCVLGNQSGTLATILWFIGSIAYLISISFGAATVARITYKQLKGDEFYPLKNACSFTKKHRAPILLTSVVFLSIMFFFIIFASLFALIGKIPYFGELFFSILYLVWFIGALFVVYTVFVFLVSLLFTPAIVGTSDEDTMGTVFHNYILTWTQPWRILIYSTLTIFLSLISMGVLGFFISTTIEFINSVFGADFLMGSKVWDIIGYPYHLTIGGYSPLFFLFGTNTSIPLYTGLELNTPNTLIDCIGSIFVCGSFFILVTVVVSYGLSICTVGHTLSFLVLRKKTDNINLLERKDEEEIAEAKKKESAQETPNETNTIQEKEEPKTS